MKMFLYVLSQTRVRGYDTYDSCVVAAASPAAAKKIHPRGDVFGAGDRSSWSGSTWADSPDDVTCTRIGTAKPGTKPGVIVTSFNPG